MQFMVSGTTQMGDYSRLPTKSEMRRGEVLMHVGRRKPVAVSRTSRKSDCRQ